MFTIVFMILRFSASVNAGNRRASEFEALARKWAPLIRLDKCELWKPSSVDFFLKNVNLVSGDGKIIKTQLDSCNLPQCDENCYLQTKEEIPTPSTWDLKFFFGQSLSDVPLYVFIDQTNPTRLRIRYSVFSPYNRGKPVCIGRILRDHCPCELIQGKCFCPRETKCEGYYKEFGHHVSDWEYMDLFFDPTGRIPAAINLISHGIPAVYFFNGKDFVNRQTGQKIQFHGTHPIAYKTRGSHGFRSAAGEVVYFRLFGNNELSDITSDGEEWKTWENLQITQVKRKYTGDFSFANYKGRWGNLKRGCEFYEAVSGECILGNGIRLSI
ncbi:uncharacterized protein [Clytia hemisphaerica]|uniref:Uncharacterized protein n=1 Tax=Clytia hemisphaerica TaxID=252671 RepID=A0A7M5WLK3_9CNID